MSKCGRLTCIIISHHMISCFAVPAINLGIFKSLTIWHDQWKGPPLKVEQLAEKERWVIHYWGVLLFMARPGRTEENQGPALLWSRPSSVKVHIKVRPNFRADLVEHIQTQSGPFNQVGPGWAFYNSFGLVINHLSKLKVKPARAELKIFYHLIQALLIH